MMMRSIALDRYASCLCTHLLYTHIYLSVSHDTRHAWSLKSLWMLNAYGYVALGRMNYAPFTRRMHVHVILYRESDIIVMATWRRRISVADDAFVLGVR